jgi:hypothetical protein
VAKMTDKQRAALMLWIENEERRRKVNREYTARYRAKKSAERSAPKAREVRHCDCSPLCRKLQARSVTQITVATHEIRAKMHPSDHGAGD